MAKHILTIGCFIVALLGGYLAEKAGIPLAWVLGPLLVTAIFAISGAKPFAPLAGHRFGQLIIGSAIGLNVTPGLAASMVSLLPVMVISAFVAMLIGAGIAIGLAHFSRVDTKTAFFCMMPGGLSEMANVGAKHGAQHEPIAVSQALRVALVVCLLPPLLVGLDWQSTLLDELSTNILLADRLPFLAVTGLAGVFLVRYIKLNNPWMIGSLVGVGIASGFGLFDGLLPRELFYAGQFLLGISIGSRFKREAVLALGKFTLASGLCTMLITALLFGYGILLSSVTDLDIASTVLSVAPGGFAEMTVTAEMLHLNIAAVTAFHVIRASLVNSLTTHYFKLLTRVGFFSAGHALLYRLFRRSSVGK